MLAYPVMNMSAGKKGNLSESVSSKIKNNKRKVREWDSDWEVGEMRVARLLWKMEKGF
jgi:hypothetical protein